jgi:hypothetical protein
MKLGRGAKIGLGTVLIILGCAAMFSSVDEHILGPLALTVAGFPVLPFLLLCGGLWLIVYNPTKGAT